jgi:hypothetical protein
MTSVGWTVARFGVLGYRGQMVMPLVDEAELPEEAYTAIGG